MRRSQQYEMFKVRRFLCHSPVKGIAHYSVKLYRYNTDMRETIRGSVMDHDRWFPSSSSESPDLEYMF